jgi:hypothetical protein
MSKVVIWLTFLNHIDVTIDTDKNGKFVASITSEGFHLNKDEPDYDVEYEAAIDGFESLILGLACAGVDISTEQFREGVVSAVDAIGNNY